MKTTDKSIWQFFVVWIFGILLIYWLSFSTFLHNPVTGKNNFYESLANWDGGYFLEIAENDYTKNVYYAFFPLYPVLINAFHNLTGANYLTAALLLSFSFTVGSIFLLIKLLKLDFEKSLISKSIIYLLIFPTSFYLLLPYSESLFLFLTLAMFLSIRKGNIFLATLFAILSSSTRLVGLAVVLALWTEVYYQKNNHKNFWIVFLAPLGFLGYCYFLLKKTGDPFYFLVAEQNWQRTLSFPGVGIWQTIKSFFIDNSLINSPTILIDLLIFTLILGLAIRSVRFLRHSYAVYALSSIIFPLLTPTLLSMPRFGIVIFPIFIMIAMLKKENFKYYYAFISVLLFGLYISLFINGFWVS